MTGPIGTMPPGSAVSPAMLTHAHRAGPWCLAVKGDLEHTCWRRKGHSGRHAEIVGFGSLYAVWGEDEHKAARERARLAEILANVVPAVPEGGAS